MLIKLNKDRGDLFDNKGRKIPACGILIESKDDSEWRKVYGVEQFDIIMDVLSKFDLLDPEKNFWKCPIFLQSFDH